MGFDALCRHNAMDEPKVAALSAPTFDIFKTLCAEIAATPELEQLKSEVADGGRSDAWCIIDDLIIVKGKVFMSRDSAFLVDILGHKHGTGHEGMKKTWHQLRLDFHVPGTCSPV
jgi:hypothetical protein